MDDAMLLMSPEKSFDKAVADAADRLRTAPDATWHDAEAWD